MWPRFTPFDVPKYLLSIGLFSYVHCSDYRTLIQMENFILTVQPGFCLSLTSTSENNSKGHQYEVNKRELSGETLFHGNKITLNDKWTSSKRSGLHGWLPSDEIIQWKADWLAAHVWKTVKSQGFFQLGTQSCIGSAFISSKREKPFGWYGSPSHLHAENPSYKDSLKLAKAMVVVGTMPRTVFPHFSNFFIYISLEIPAKFVSGHSYTPLYLVYKLCCCLNIWCMMVSAPPNTCA